MLALPVIVEHVRVSACRADGCHDCCREPYQAVLNIDEGDDPEDYETHEVTNHLHIDKKPNGDCIYLEPGVGCTIYANAPYVCRVYDCKRGGA